MTLNHIHIGTKNLGRSKEFYESFFGFKKKYDHGHGVFLEDDKGFLIAIDPVEDLSQMFGLLCSIRSIEKGAYPTLYKTLLDRKRTLQAAS